MDNYILDGHNAVVEPDIVKWAQWYEKADRRVKKTELPCDVKVSTVFLGMDHSWNEGPPLLFETMVFGGEHDSYCDRCSTWEQAEEMHEKTVAMIFQVEK